jgi:DNA-binding MarR family transcriptional regulator
MKGIIMERNASRIRVIGTYFTFLSHLMGDILNIWLKQTVPLESGLEAMLNLLVASKFVEGDMETVLQPFGVTRRQYNVLRILKGVYPGGHPRSEIAARVLEQSPDITRIIDRLEEQGLIKRSRGKEDKRESLTMITPKGITLIEKAAPYVIDYTRSLEKILTPDGCLKLSELCEKLYEKSISQ